MLLHTDTLFALAAVLVWCGCTWLATVKYLAAYKAKKRLDKIIWFIVWCLLITMIEWIVLFLFTIACGVAGVGCGA